MRKIASFLVCILIPALAYGQTVTLGSGTVPDGTSGTTGTINFTGVTAAPAPSPCAEPIQIIQDEGSYFTNQHYHRKETVK